MARPTPYWAQYLPSWREKTWPGPAEIKFNKTTQHDSSTKSNPRCEGCTWSCDKCPYK